MAGIWDNLSRNQYYCAEDLIMIARLVQKLLSLKSSLLNEMPVDSIIDMKSITTLGIN